jgi:hypothetical protein
VPTPRTDTGNAIRGALISPNESDPNGEAANVVDGLFAIARAIEQLAGRSNDPREFGLHADDLRCAADALYLDGDPRLDRRAPDDAERLGRIRSRLRGLADAIDETA